MPFYIYKLAKMRFEVSALEANPQVTFCFKGTYKVGISGKAKPVVQNERKDNFEIVIRVTLLLNRVSVAGCYLIALLKMNTPCDFLKEIEVGYTFFVFSVSIPSGEESNGFFSFSPRKQPCDYCKQ